MVIFSATFLTFPSPSFEKFELESLQQKIICNQVVPVLRLKDTGTLYPPRISDHLQKRTHLFGRQS